MCDEVGGAGGQMVCMSCKMTLLLFGLYLLAQGAEVEPIYAKH